MCKEVLILSGSTRKNGNTELLANAFMQGALSSGHHVTMTHLRNLKIQYCTGCASCRKNDGYLVGYNLRKPGEINNNDIEKAFQIGKTL